MWAPTRCLRTAYRALQRILNFNAVALFRYLGGVLDFTGELNRYAVLQATQRNVEAVRTCRGLVEGIFGQFLQVSL
jgi:predicted translin family RNA/ssDNA-binding protein